MVLILTDLEDLWAVLVMPLVGIQALAGTLALVGMQVLVGIRDLDLVFI